MSLLYITADKVGIPTGGGTVTLYESEALQSLGPCEVWDRDFLDRVKKYYINASDPWQHDANARAWLDEPGFGRDLNPSLTHLYAGTFGQTVAALRDRGCKITYTAAAHDKEASRREHEKFGIDFKNLYPHLCELDLWERYQRGYKEADVLICPSQSSAQCMRKYGCTQRIEVIPHGCHLPEKVAPLPKTFTVGYLGAYGPDKGVIYLLQAWKKLNYPYAILMLGGRDSTSDYVQQMVREYGGGNVMLRGWLDNVSDFYNSISLYVQPSVTEGFGIEVLEAMAHGRPVLCSSGAGACDLLGHQWRFSPGNVDNLCRKMESVKEKTEWNNPHNGIVDHWNAMASKYTWDKIQSRYVTLWQELIG